MNAYLACNEAQICLRYRDKQMDVNTEEFSTRTLLAAYIDLGEVVHRRLECASRDLTNCPLADS